MIELMITLVVLAILAGLAVPSFKSTLDRRAIQGEAGRLARSINMARSKAVTGGVMVTMESLSGTADWSSGWRIFVDGNNAVSSYVSDCDPPAAPAVSTCDELVSNFTIDANKISILSSGNAEQYISFDARGRLVNGGGVVVVAVCDTDHSANMDGSRVEISTTGRVLIEPITAATKAAECTP